ncbi:hypothetical protein GOBAR_AA01419 [Gossypium barbadense]|uniref:Uncharacterized protein n=1 Tax=Gossypium barbadense TaxID=3634 RepID=A0A2P5YU80_GOSBA|nr:hypothetical protein GOBAR_AA01419 [Gossypium barbadense]
MVINGIVFNHLYGDAFPPSPRKGRSPVSRDRKFRDRPSPLGPLGKTQSIVPEESISKTQDQSATELLSLGSRPPPDVASVEDGEEVEQVAGSPGVQSRSPVTAPIGISINFSGARKSLPSYHPETCQTKGELPDTRSLINRLQKKLETEGINIPVDCVNLLNNGLDAYLKRLIEPSIRLAGLRSQSRNYSQRAGERSFNASMMDFRAAMELNPRLYGDAFPPSPRKGRSPVSRDRKFRDRPSPLGPLGKTQSIVPEESISKTQDQSATELLSLGSRPPPDVASVEDGEEVEQVAGSPGVQSRSPVTAPIGISINFSGARKSLPSYHPETCQTKGELPDTRSLINRLQKKLETEGINIPVDCVNLLNNGLDAYLKRLIEPSIRLAGLRSQSRNYSQRAGERSFNASMMDFRAAMELNPRVLGEDWPLQLEKISLSSLED